MLLTEETTAGPERMIPYQVTTRHGAVAYWERDNTVAVEVGTPTPTALRCGDRGRTRGRDRQRHTAIGQRGAVKQEQCREREQRGAPAAGLPPLTTITRTTPDPTKLRRGDIRGVGSISSRISPRSHPRIPSTLTDRELLLDRDESTRRGPASPIGISRRCAVADDESSSSRPRGKPAAALWSCS